MSFINIFYIEFKRVLLNNVRVHFCVGKQEARAETVGPTCNFATMIFPL